MIYTGLVSITFRNLTAAQIIALVKKAGLDGIEWGGDIHVPHGDVEAAERVRKMTEEANLKVAAYGSYYKVGVQENAKEEFLKVLGSAVVLKAPVIRVWAGNMASSRADEEWWQKIIEESRMIADLAEKEGIKIAYEYHGNTLTDTIETAERLLREVNHGNVLCYWQPHKSISMEERIKGLKMIQPWLSNIHAFYWVEDEKCPLKDGADIWGKYMEVISETPGDRYVMIEFVKEGLEEQFLEDAKILKEIVNIDNA